MAAFPTTIACVITSGFGEGFPKVKKYLGGNSFVFQATGKVTAKVETHADMEAFTRWYITDIENGTKSFTLNVPFFGVTRDWEVKLTQEINTKPNDKAAFIRDIPMALEIVDDINDYIAS